MPESRSEPSSGEWRAVEGLGAKEARTNLALQDPFALLPMETDSHPESIHAFAFEDAVREGVDVPLAALRAALENLMGGYDSSSPERLVVESVLTELGNLRRNVQGLVDFVLPPTHHPMPCQAEEVVVSALNELTAAKRSRVVVAIDQDLPRLQVDGARLARTLRFLLECVLESPFSEALLHCQDTGRGLSFGVVSENGHVIWTSSNVHALQLALADRELRRMGARLDTSSKDGLFARFALMEHREVA